MLEGNFFTISAIQKEEALTKVMVEINPAHTIFEGHFPGQPVVPGACLLQILKEVLQNITGQILQLQKANQLKFISLIDPSKNHVLQLRVTHSAPENSKISVSATVLFDTTVAFKFNGVFQFE
ncbi:MAG: 3-hydroxyacyl-ACP dehydratase [Sediminibacterium sp.]